VVSSSIREKVSAQVRGYSLPTPWPGGRTALTWVFGVAILGFVLQLLPRPSGWPLAFLFAEDGQIFLTQVLRDGGLNLLQPYAGYLHVVPRGIAGVCSTAVSPDIYVLCTGSAAGLIKVLGMLIAWPVITAYAQSWKWGLLGAASFLFIPVGHLEVLGNITNLRWFLVAAAFFAVFGLFRAPTLAITATLIAFAASLSDPLALAWLPFAIWRALTSHGWSRIPSIGLIIGGVIHLLHLQPEERGERGDITDLLGDPLDTIAQLLVRGPVVTQNGMIFTQDFLRFGVVPTLATLVITACVIAAAWRGRSTFAPAWRLAILLFLVAEALLFAVLSFPASYIAFTEIWSPSQPSRYSAFAALFLTPALILLMSVAWRSSAGGWRRFMVIVAAVMLTLAYLSDARGDSRHSSGMPWNQTLIQVQQACSKGNDPVQVPNVPDYEGWQTLIPCAWVNS